jgi:hypothetical protein
LQYFWSYSELSGSPASGGSGSLLSIDGSVPGEGTISVQGKQNWKDVLNNVTQTETGFSAPVGGITITVDFVKLDPVADKPYGMRQESMPINETTPMKLGGSIWITGQVKVTPAAGRAHVTLSIVQTKNTNVKILPLFNAATSGADPAFSTYPQGKSGADLMDIVGYDHPGPVAPLGKTPGAGGAANTWKGALPLDGTVDMNFNDYLRCVINTTKKPVPPPKTLGKASWGMHGVFKAKVDPMNPTQMTIQDQAGAVTPGAGAASADAPAAPTSSAP